MWRTNQWSLGAEVGEGSDYKGVAHRGVLYTDGTFLCCGHSVIVRPHTFVKTHNGT